MSTQDSTGNKKYFKALEFSAVNSLLKSTYNNQIFGENHDKTLKYIENQGLARDDFYKVYKEIKGNAFLNNRDNKNFLGNILSDFLGNSLSLFIGAFGYSNITKNVFALSAFGGLINLQVQKFLIKESTFLDFIFGVMSTMQGVYIAQDIALKDSETELFDDDINDIYLQSSVEDEYIDC